MGATFLSKYLNARFTNELVKPGETKQKGVVVTISRDTGCDATPIVKELVKLLNSELKGPHKKTPWQFVSKEIFEQSAKELNVKPEIFERLESTKEKGFVEDLLHSLSTEGYPSEFKIKKTFKEVISSVAKGGGVIILGRGGVAIVGRSKRTIHIKLTAPLEWRVDNISKKKNFTKAKALKYVNEFDSKRDKFKKYYMGRKVQPTDFDMILNVGTLSKKEICSTVISLIHERTQ